LGNLFSYTRILLKTPLNEPPLPAANSDHAGLLAEAVVERPSAVVLTAFAYQRLGVRGLTPKCQHRDELVHAVVRPGDERVAEATELIEPGEGAVEKLREDTARGEYVVDVLYGDHPVRIGNTT
jgi:hypothetical protein